MGKRNGMLAAMAAMIMLAQPVQGAAPKAAEPSAAVMAQRMDHAKALTELLVAEEMIIEGNLGSFVIGFDANNNRNPAAVEMFKQHPGLREAIVSAGQSFMRQLIVQSYPELASSATTFYATSLTVSELEQATLFYRSPLGRKIIMTMMNPDNAKPMIDSRLDNPGKAFDRADGAAIDAAAQARVIKSLSTAEMAEASKFGMSPVGRKLQALQPEINDLTALWINTHITPNIPKMQEITNRTARDFLVQEEQDAAAASSKPHTNTER